MTLNHFTTYTYAQAQRVYTYTVTKNTYNSTFSLGNNESLYIPAGITFTGNLNWNGTNCAVYNDGNWSTGNDIHFGKKGALYTSATSQTKVGNLNLTDGVTITNKGSLQAGVNWNGSGATITTSGSWICASNIPIGQAGTLTIEKTGSVSCRDLNLNSTGATVYNWGQLALDNCQTASATTLRNYSQCIVRGYTNNSGKLYNEGYWKCNTYNNNTTTNNCGTIEVGSKYQNNGNSLLLNAGKLATHELINDGNIQGPLDGKSVGKVIVDSQFGYQLCRQNGSGKIGVVGRIDLSRCSPGLFGTFLSWLIGISGWDIQTGTLGSNYSYNTNLQNGGCVDQVLPVELASFTAQVRGTAVLLAWSTASEKNNDHFVVERSIDGYAFQPLATVQGAGTTAAPTRYTSTDAHPLIGRSYYRLKQVDLDGSAHYAPVISVQVADVPAAILAAYPNPATDYLTLDLRNLMVGSTRAQLRNLAGQVVLEQAVTDGSMPQLRLKALPAGVYLLQVQTADATLAQRIVKR
ncbi:T9SS type A sorting domain-containing protein [Hymenobacter aerilatus]|uniref:T9SS type A sorting domain-containing protein n=1 Tax=Hymenobacter aerilatus TaxID=2932251 RepID=A0A8T9SVM6_9BACT|nr:T9SS type A sorting domain-containing protein [Hymenobacter aerilatus]UOR04984.1 T9SS type A sorting domain-containing protein [Hymenobacter aerilatus]